MGGLEVGKEMGVGDLEVGDGKMGVGDLEVGDGKMGVGNLEIN